MNKSLISEKQYDIIKKLGENTYRNAVENVQQGVKALVLVNGAAGIAVLAFLGNLVTDGSNFESELLTNAVKPIIWFSWGVVAAVLSIGLSYFTNISNTNALLLLTATEDTEVDENIREFRLYIKYSHVLHFATILAFMGSVIIFVIGVYSTANAILAI